MTNTTPAPPSLTNSSNAMKTIDGLSQGLRLLLQHEPSTGQAIEGIVSNPALHAEVKAALPGLIADRDQALAKPAPADLQEILGSRLTLYAVPDRSEGEWRSWWADYLDALSDLPLRAVDEAMRQWVRSPAEFYPKPGQLREIALKIPSPEYRAAYRAKMAAERPSVTFQPDAASKAAVAEMLAGFKTKAAP